MLAALILFCLVSPDGYLTIQSLKHGDFVVEKQDDLNSTSLHQRVLVYDKHGTVVWNHAGRTEASYADSSLAPDFDGDGKAEVIIVVCDYAATGHTARISVHSLGVNPKNLLVLYSHTWGRLMEDNYRTEVINGKQVLVSEENELSYWIGPRGGAPYPVAFAYSNGRLRLATNQFPQVIEAHLALATLGVDRSKPPTSFGEFYEQACFAMAEFASRAINENTDQVLEEMRRSWHAPVVDFIEANAEAILSKPTCYTYAQPYRPIPLLEPESEGDLPKPVWPPSIGSLRNPIEW